jgi:tetratricopeptide (TPR) repeat protein
MTTDAIVVSGALTPSPVSSVPAVPWRDPHTVSPHDLAAYIGALERRVRENPDSPELWTALGMAHAVNYDVVRSMEALQTATEVEPSHFWARLKHGELHYRLRALDTAESETLKAIDVAENALQLSMARRQLKEIRALNPQRVRRDAPASAWGRAIFLSMLLMISVLLII